MAILSISDLKQLVQNTIYDNLNNEISGQDVQTAIINAIDTLDSLAGFVNVHKANGQTTITAYGSKAAARAAVPTDAHFEGVVIAYKLSTGWIIEQNLDATAETWANNASWQTIGPVSVSQNTNTGGQQLYIGDTKKGNIDDFFNVNSYNNKADAYTDVDTARNAVPSDKRALGMKITYLLIDGWHEEQFRGSDINDWDDGSKWYAGRINNFISVSNDFAVGDNWVEFTNLQYKENDYAEIKTIYGNESHTKQRFIFTNNQNGLLVLKRNNTLSIVYGNDNIEAKDIILLRHSSSNKYIGGLLMPFLNKYYIDKRYIDYSPYVLKKIDFQKRKFIMDFIADLDTEIYEGKTYRDIFETNNLLGITAGFENGNYSPMIPYNEQSTGLSIQSSVKDSGNYALQVTNFGQLKLESAISFNGLFGAMRINVTEYSEGEVGLKAVAANKVFKEETDGWQTIGCYTNIATGGNMFIGSNTVAQLTAYIDTPVYIDLAMFNIAPSYETLMQLYEVYVQIKKNNNNAITIQRIINISEEKDSFSDVECKSAFVAYMNAKAQELGMTDSHFTCGSGYYYETSAITPYDALKMTLRAEGCLYLPNIWYKSEYDMHIKGPNARTEHIICTERGNFQNYYTLFGCKTGTRVGVANVVFLCNAPNDNWFIGSIINSDAEHRWDDAKKLIDIANLLYDNPQADISSITLTATGACVALMPCHQPLAYDNFTIQPIYQKNPSIAHYPASTTKVMTAICALEWINDLNDYFEIKDSDITEGTGGVYHNGDLITFKDALYAMMLPSDNTVAEAISRIIGKKILENDAV